MHLTPAYGIFALLFASIGLFKGGAPFQKVGGQFRERSERKHFLDPHTLSLPGGDRKMNTMVTEKLLLFHYIFNTRPILRLLYSTEGLHFK